MLDLAAGRDAIHRDISVARAHLDQLTAADWRNPTSLPGWTVDDLARHFAWGQELQAEAWHRSRARVREPRQPAPLNGAGRREILDALDVAHRSFMVELTSMTPDEMHRPCPLPAGSLPSWLVMQMAVMEAGIHRYDLERTLGLTATLPPDVVAAATEAVTATLPGMAQAADEQPPTGTSIRLHGERFDLTLQREAIFWAISNIAKPTCTISGQDGSVLLFALGRIGADSKELSIAGASEVALRFKAYFPGP